MNGFIPHQLAFTVIAASEGGGGGGEGGGSGSFLVSPSLGLMIWTLVVFALTFWVLRKLAFPRIQEALDRRQRAIEESIDHAERTRNEADELLKEYRERLREARGQAEEIVARARKAAENSEREGVEAGKVKKEEILEQAERDAEAKINQMAQQLRREMADLVVLATEKVTRKALSDEDQKRLVDEALEEVDFSSLGGGNGKS